MSGTNAVVTDHEGKNLDPQRCDCGKGDACPLWDTGRPDPDALRLRDARRGGKALRWAVPESIDPATLSRHSVRGTCAELTRRSVGVVACSCGWWGDCSPDSESVAYLAAEHLRAAQAVGR